MRPPAKQSGIEQAFSKTTQHQKLGAAFKHLQNGGGVPFIRLLILGLFLDESKRKAPYFKRSTVLFWWRIAGSNR